MTGCPHCGKPIFAGVMCADCADAISTNELFEMFTLGGRLSDSTLAWISMLVIWAPLCLLIGLVVLMELFRP